MVNPEEIVLAGLSSRRWARTRQVLDQRLGAVRVVLENLHHPHNMSAVLRTCEALGIQHVHAVETAEDFIVSRRITLGAHKWLTLHRHDTALECAEELKTSGFRIYAAMLDAAALPLSEIPVDAPVALVFGNEKAGVSKEFLRLCDGSYVIPMFGFAQSFNISVATAISLYSLISRVRAHRPDQGLLSPAEKVALLESWLPKAARWARRSAQAARGFTAWIRTGETPSP